MSSQPGRPHQPYQVATNERNSMILDTAQTSVAYVTLIIGYLSTILTTLPHLDLLNFLVFTALQVGYVVALRWMLRAACDPRGWRLVVGLALLVMITEAVGLLPLLNLQWDWLLFLVTVSICFLYVPLRGALGAGILLYVTAVVEQVWLVNWNWSQTYLSLLTLLPAFAFVAIFSLVVRFLQEQKEQAELLLRQLEVSNAELARAHAQLQAYADDIEELTIVRERTRLAREIHDSLGHYLSILNIQLETISKLQERDPARAAVEIAEARRVAAQSMQEVRNAVAALRPTSIAALSLPEALAQLGKEFERSLPGTALTLDLETELPPLTPDLVLALYRAAQESLTNIRKHARASKALVRLRYEDEALELLVLDNGPAATPGEETGGKGGFGLVGLRERIELLGGQIAYGADEQGGYRVMVRVPFPALARTFPPAELAQAGGTPQERVIS